MRKGARRVTKEQNLNAEPWERQPGESVRNYEHFCAYRDMRYLSAPGDEIPKPVKKCPRSIRKLAEALGLTKRTVDELSTRFRWVERCDAYDLHILNLQRNANEAAYLEMLENQAAVGKLLWKRGVRRLQTLPDSAIKPEDVIRMADIGVKIERASRERLLSGIGAASDGKADNGISDETRAEVEALVKAESEAVCDTPIDPESG